MELWQAILLWLAGCAGRFVIPYVSAGFMAVGEANDWKAWPAWEWKLLTAFILASGAFLATLLSPAMRELLITMAPETIILAGYVGQDLGRQVIKAIPKKPS